MENFGDKARVDHCVLLMIAIKQMMHDTGPLTDPAAIEYAEQTHAFFNYTMQVCERLGERRGLHLVE